MEWYFAFKTKRKSSEIGINFYNELILFINVVVWANFSQVYKVYDPEISFADEDMTPDQWLMCAIIHQKLNANYTFTLIIAVMAFNTWLKLLLRMQITRTFGPMFKMLINMSYDLF